MLNEFVYFYTKRCRKTCSIKSIIINQFFVHQFIILMIRVDVIDVIEQSKSSRAVFLSLVIGQSRIVWKIACF